MGIKYNVAASVCAISVIMSAPSALAFPPQYAPNQSALWQQAIDAYNAKEFKKAEELDTRAINEDFRNPGIWGHRSLVRKALGDEVGAYRDNSTYIAAQQVADLGDDSQVIFNVIAAGSYVRNAQYWLQKNDMLRAFIDSSVAVKVDGNYSLAQLIRADTLYWFGHFAEAQKFLAAAQSLDPAGNIRRDFTLDEAQQNAVIHKPPLQADDFKPQLAAIDVAKRNGDLAEQLKIYDAMIATFPLSDYLWANRGLVHAQNNQLEAAIDDLTIAIDLGGGFGSTNTTIALQNRAFAYNKQEKFEEAYIDLEYAHKLKPDDAEIVRQLGFLKLRFNYKHLPGF